MMQQAPKSLVRIVEREPDSLQLRRRIAPHDCRLVIADIDVTVMAESRLVTARHDALLLGYADLVRHIAYHLFRRRNYVDVDDLIRAGMVRLSENVRRHGYDSAGPLEADASVCIRAAMLDFVRTSDWSLRSDRKDPRGVEDVKPAGDEKRRECELQSNELIAHYLRGPVYATDTNHLIHKRIIAKMCD
jgi:hypothetical protein